MLHFSVGVSWHKSTSVVLLSYVIAGSPYVYIQLFFLLPLLCLVDQRVFGKGASDVFVDFTGPFHKLDLLVFDHAHHVTFWKLVYFGSHIFRVTLVLVRLVDRQRFPLYFRRFAHICFDSVSVAACLTNFLLLRLCFGNKTLNALGPVFFLFAPHFKQLAEVKLKLVSVPFFRLFKLIQSDYMLAQTIRTLTRQHQFLLVELQEHHQVEEVLPVLFLLLRSCILLHGETVTIHAT